MEQLIAKRKTYLEEIEKLNAEIEEEVQKYYNDRLVELHSEAEEYRKEIAKNYEAKFTAINNKIEILDEIISEQMPLATEVKELIEETKSDEAITGPKVEIVKVLQEEEIPEREDIVMKDEETVVMPEVVAEETPKEEEIITEEIANDIPNCEDNTMVAEEPAEEPIIEETKEIVEETIEEPAAEEAIIERIVNDDVEQRDPIRIETYTNNSRPGMSGIFNPR